MRVNARQVRMEVVQAPILALDVAPGIPFIIKRCIGERHEHSHSTIIRAEPHRKIDGLFHGVNGLAGKAENKIRGGLVPETFGDADGPDDLRNGFALLDRVEQVLGCGFHPEMDPVASGLPRLPEKCRVDLISPNAVSKDPRELEPPLDDDIADLLGTVEIHGEAIVLGMDLFEPEGQEMLHLVNDAGGGFRSEPPPEDGLGAECAPVRAPATRFHEPNRPRPCDGLGRLVPGEVVEFVGGKGKRIKIIYRRPGRVLDDVAVRLVIYPLDLFEGYLLAISGRTKSPSPATTTSSGDAVRVSAGRADACGPPPTSRIFGSYRLMTRPRKTISRETRRCKRNPDDGRDELVEGCAQGSNDVMFNREIEQPDLIVLLKQRSGEGR